MADQTNAVLRGHRDAIQQLQAQVAQLVPIVQALGDRPRTVAEEIDSIPGRRMEGTLDGSVTFTAADEGQRGAPIIIQVSQDGPFVQTHYPLALWLPTAPDNTTNFGRWRPVSTYPLPTQVVGTDIIDISYEMQDGGNQRLLQNAPRVPLLSTPENIVPCPVPTLWATNSAILFIPTYRSFTWNSGTPPTEGTLFVTIPGYRIVNM